MRSRGRIVASLVLLPLLFAACASDDGSGTASTGADETTNATGGETGPAAATGASRETLSTASSAYGDIVVDAEGRTLYVFMADKNGKSTCYDDCEAAWPPLTVDGSPSAEGVDASLLGTSERDDGSTQVTLDEQPLYYFADDAAPGDTNGQGASDVWYVVSPDGAAITKTTNAAPRYDVPPSG